MKNTSFLFPATGVSALFLFASLTGCTNTPTRLSTAAIDSVPALRAQADQNYQAPTPVKTVQPEYPVALRRSGTSGSVDVLALVDDTGRVQEADVENYNHYEIARAAATAVRQWTFKPAVRDGVPVAQWITVPFVFNMTDE